ncbi:MAG: DMT family transporter [Magnetovibrio sp.]|nr:DMT family transporter [Magnetovibrio sp.]
MDLPPYAFALIAAFLFALGDQFQALGLAHMGSRAGAAVSITASAAAFWLVAPWFLEISHFGHPAVLLFIFIGLIRPALSANLAIAAIRHLGPTLAGTLSSISPLFGVLFGVFWLGEILTWPIALGTGGIILAVISQARPGGTSVTGWPLWALLLPMGAAAIRSLSHAVTKVGMIEIPDPYFAALVGFTVSALLTTGLHQFQPSAGAGGLKWRGAGATWFLISGFTFAAAVLSLNHGLMTGEIITVVPIIAAAPVFTMLLSIVVFRRERITQRTVIALALVVPSVVTIVLNR